MFKTAQTINQSEALYRSCDKAALHVKVVACIIALQITLDFLWYFVILLFIQRWSCGNLVQSPRLVSDQRGCNQNRPLDARTLEEPCIETLPDASLSPGGIAGLVAVSFFLINGQRRWHPSERGFCSWSGMIAAALSASSGRLQTNSLLLLVHSLTANPLKPLPFSSPLSTTDQWHYYY